jgi:hypothetical protein
MEFSVETSKPRDEGAFSQMLFEQIGHEQRESRT